ncbi:MAG: hypothetical protein IJH53_05540 [Oscillospiraceae bacterium]|nr:hypothetical protein [Oscillospiraceae bacterium]
MSEKKFHKTLITALALILLLTTLSGCGGNTPAAEPDVPVQSTEPAGQTGPSETEAAPGRQDGERFEDIIILEGMEETVRYEHVRNDAIGFEMDFDYEQFERRSGTDRECFVSVWDLPEKPENYLVVRYDPRDAATAAAAIGEALSAVYDICREDSFELACAGSCIRIDASNGKGNTGTPDRLQMVYIFPAADGCRIAAAHYYFESAEGFGRRFRYLMDTFSVLPAQGENRISEEQALAAVRQYCFSNDPGLESLVNAGEYPVYWDVSSDENVIVVLFRSYTGAQIRYYVDPVSGETYVTEFVPGITAEEERTAESLNVRDYTA